MNYLMRKVPAVNGRSAASAAVFKLICLSQTMIKDKIRNGSFADDLQCLTQRLFNLHTQADKLSRYADWQPSKSQEKKKMKRNTM